MRKRFLCALLAAALLLAAVPAAYADEQERDLIALIEKVNDYWISSHMSPPGYSWDVAAYYNGNMDAYYLTGIEEYRAYAENWAVANGWSGSTNIDPRKWTNGDVYHADNQTCFQTYIDLYNLDETKDPRKIARALEVAHWQTAEDKRDFWWWCDALYMAMPYYTKLYTLTGDISYLDAMYEYFAYAKSIMYDGEGGIAPSGEQVNLFYRDAGYIGTKYNGEKNIWARGTGWVMAALAKTLDGVPTDWEHYNDLKKVYLEMAAACKKYIKTDDKGRKYFTQSVIPFYPVSEANPNGYETSGTAFIIYSIYWGMNSGLLDRREYLETAEGGLRYLTEVAIQDSGFVGYVQPIGSNAVGAVNVSDTHNFGVGGTLSALCEAERFYNGTKGDIYPYLTKKLVGAAAIKEGSSNIYTGGKASSFGSDVYMKNLSTMVPARAIAEATGARVVWDGKDQSVSFILDAALVVFEIGEAEYSINGARKSMAEAPEINGGVTYVPLEAIAEALGKKIYTNEKYGTIILGNKKELFYDCDAAMIDMLNSILESGALPERPAHEARSFKMSIAQSGTVQGTASKLEIENAINIVSAEASNVPEPENNITNAFDNDLGSRWAITRNMSGVFDLGQVYELKEIALLFWKYNTRQTDFELLVSSDGFNYESIYNGLSDLSADYTVIPVGRKARYIKLIGHGNTENGSEWTSLLDIVPIEG